LLPEKPERLKRHEKSIQFLEDIRKSQRKRGSDYWINKYEDFEAYSFYLMDILENYNIDYLSKDDWSEKEKIATNEYISDIEALQNDYDMKLLNANN
jgi:hypothetical protein